MRFRHVAAVAAAISALASLAGARQGRAEGQGGGAPSVEELQAELRRLRLEQEDTLDDLTFRLETLERELAAAQAAARQGAASVPSANVLNPGITVFGDFLGRLDDSDVFVDDDPSQDVTSDTLHLREVELDLRAAIDPWADGVVVAAFESEVPGDFSAEIEEGYVVLKKLPVLDAAPGGLKLTLGRFRPLFGRFNVVHLHDLPQPTYPRSLGSFLGPEGLIADGAAARFFLPSWSDSQTLEGTIQVVSGGGAPATGDLEPSDVTGIGHVGWFAEIGRSSTVDAGASALVGDADHRLYGADATYEWKPYAAGEWRSLLVGGEVFVGDFDDPAFDAHPVGWYAWSQYQFTKNLYLGARYDRTEELADASDATTTVGSYLTYYTTEFLRFRLGLEHAESDLEHLDGVDSALLEVSFVFGSHPVEPYWVDR